MISDPRTISYVLECVHQPIRIDQSLLKKLYARTSEDARLAYGNFNSGPAGAKMMTVHGPASFPNATSHSILSVGADRFQMVEEWPSVGLEDFIDRARAAAALVLNELPIPRLAAIQCVIRSLVSVGGVEDSRAWLNERFHGMGEAERATFGRDPMLFGLRFSFPAGVSDPAVHNVRIESFNADARSLYLEDASLRTLPENHGDDVEAIDDMIRGAYDFLTGPVTDWLDAQAGGAA